MGARRRAREHALKMLYQADVAGITIPAAMAGYWSIEPEPDDDVRRFAELLADGVAAERDAIDELIGSISHHWRLDRMDTIERNVLRLAIGELRGHPGTPPAVVIDEAVELARAYGGAESHVFVNGILEAARRRLATPPS